MLDLLVFSLGVGLALAVMHMYAYNQGFEDGEKVGKAEALFNKNGLVLKHNGEVEKFQ